jgi:hypothetical protein
VGLFSYKKVLHPARTTRRATVRAVTPKSLRKVRRAAITARHPASSLEGAAKASLSRSVLRGGRSRSRSGSRSAVAVGVFIGGLVFIALFWAGVISVYHAVSRPSVKIGPQGWIGGDVRSMTGGDYSAIQVGLVRCRWNGHRVETQIRVTSHRSHGIKLTISPQYELAAHGSHGGSIEGYKDQGIPARATRVLLVDAGSPQGVSGQPRITSCSPDLVSVSGW